jgi:hypothetical protein
MHLALLSTPYSAAIRRILISRDESDDFARCTAVRCREIQTHQVDRAVERGGGFSAAGGLLADSEQAGGLAMELAALSVWPR